VYYRAWKLSSGQTRLKVEHACIQDLMHRGIHAAHQQTAKAVRKVRRIAIDSRLLFFFLS
jgi:hypothetical protein